MAPQPYIQTTFDGTQPTECASCAPCRARLALATLPTCDRPTDMRSLLPPPAPLAASKGFFSKNKPPPTPYPGSTSYSAIPPSQTPSGGKPGKKPAKGKEKPAEKPKKSKGGFFSALAEEFVNEFVGQVAEGVAEDAFDGGS